MSRLLDRLPERIVFLHAHPDDEGLSTGAMIAEATAAQREVAVVTATRGERGEVTPGYEALAGTPQLAAAREQELHAALRVLGVAAHAFLGEPPARAAGLAPRRYEDSGMQWLTPQWAGPDPDAGPESLTRSDRAAASADFAAFVRAWGPHVIVSYDKQGGYGHPDHVACHEIAAATARATGLPLWTIGDAALREPGPGEQLYELPQHAGIVAAALAEHASQLIVDDDGVRYSGGQRHPIPTSFILGARNGDSAILPGSIGRPAREEVDDLPISELGPHEAGELLTLQRAAYLTEAAAHRDFDLPPLTESLDMVRAALQDPSVTVLGIRLGGRLVGSVRLRRTGEVVELGRLIVAPDLQGRGLGTRMLREAENAFSGTTEIRLFTGEHSIANIRLYSRMGYRETGRTTAGGYDLVNFTKRIS